MSAQEILIVGCGDIGSRTARRLLATNHQVHGARRNPENLPEGVQPVQLDVADAESWQALTDNSPTLKPDYIIYSVAAGGFSEEFYKSAYAEGVKQMLRWLKKSKHTPKHILFVSSTSIYGQTEGETVDENTVPHPSGFAGSIMLKAEEALRKSGLNHTCVRFSGIYGPGRDMLIRQVRQGRIAPEVPIKYTNRIHSEDCAGVLAHLVGMVEAGKTPAPVYLATDNGSAPLFDVMNWMADVLQVTPTEVVESPTRRRTSKICDNSLLLSTGYEFTYPTYREGYREALQEVKAQIKAES